MSKDKKDREEYGHKHGEKDYQHDEPTGEHLKGDAEYSPQMDGTPPSGRLSSKEDISEYKPEMDLRYKPTLKQYAMGGPVGPVPVTDDTEGYRPEMKDSGSPKMKQYSKGGWIPEPDFALPSREDITDYRPEMNLRYKPTLQQYAKGGPVAMDRDEDARLAKDVLRKMVDDMHGVEAARIHPIHPEHEGVKNPTADKGETFDEAEPENSENQHDLNPKVLGDLLNKAGSAHPDGSTSEDLEEELPEEIRSAVSKKRKVGQSLKETR
jgi:hypothetical protein